MDKYEDTVVNPNISLKNFEVKVRDDVQDKAEPSQFIPTNIKANKKNHQKSILLLVLLAGILIYQLTIAI